MEKIGLTLQLRNSLLLMWIVTDISTKCKQFWFYKQFFLQTFYFRCELTAHPKHSSISEIILTHKQPLK